MRDDGFGDEVRKAIARAREEAVRLGHDYVGTEHLLLGVLGHPGYRARLQLVALGVKPAEVEARVADSVRPGRGRLPAKQLPYTSRAKKSLELAAEYAREGGHSEITTEHLLMGLLLERKGIAAMILTSLGVTPDRLRAAPSELGGVSRFRITLDDASTSSIYEQIVAQVKEAVATGELAAGARLPAVRQLADQLDIAPGTVARAYSELERLRVVVTDGARGTRVADRADAVRGADQETIVGLLRPVAVAAFHMGAAAADVRRALDAAMEGILD